MKKTPLIFLGHILENIERIEEFTKGVSKESFLKDKEKQYAVVRGVEIIGEAAKNLALSFREKHPSVQWNKITGTRDKLIHQYFGVDLHLLWDIVKEELPVLKKQVQKILEAEKRNL